MIPKKIHYCWFGGKPIPDSVRRCMQSWQKFCPDYLIVEWNEKNFNIKIAVIGGLAGIICGLFGTGGGMILVPAFIYMLDIEPKKARATSLCMLAMVIASSFFYYKNNYINWNSGLLCAIGGIFGGYIGAIILKKVPDYILKILFTIFILYYAYRMLFVL